MASTASAFWQTLLTATSEFNTVLTGTNALLDFAWTDIKPVTAGIGEKLNILIPANVNSQVVDNPYADPIFNDFALTPITVELSHKPQYGVLVRSFEQFNSPTDIISLLLDPGVKGVMAKANQYLANLLIPSNFTTTPITTTGSAIPTSSFLQAQQQLIDNLVNVQAGPQWMRFVQASAPWTRMMGDTNWAQESVVGAAQAEAMRVTGCPRIAFGAGLNVDQAMPTTGSSPNKVYTSIYGSRASLVAAFRPLPGGDEGARTTYMVVGGVPLRIMLSFQHLKDAHALTIDVGMGVATGRPEQAVLFQTAQ